MIKKILLSCVVLVLLSGCGEEAKAEVEFGVCKTSQDAMNMMIASQAYGQTLQKKYFAEKKIADKAYDDYQKRKLESSEELEKINKLQKKMTVASSKWVEYIENLNSISRVINAKKYQEACDSYVELAEIYGFDLKEASKSTITMQQLQSDGAKKGGACGVEEASVALMFFIEDAAKKGLTNKPAVKDMMENSGLDAIQNPNKICERLKSATKKVGFSYDMLIQRTKSHLATNKTKQNQQRKITENNAKNNKKCTVNDAIELSYKMEDYLDNYRVLEDRWFRRYRAAGNATLNNSSLEKALGKKRNEMSAATSRFMDEFKREVKVHIGDGQYDLACSNYEKLVKKHDLLINKYIKDYEEFGQKKQTKKTNVSSSDNAGNQSSGDNSTGLKYNLLVGLINDFSPKIRSSFKTYVKANGKEKERQKDMYTNLGGMKVKLPNTYYLQEAYSGSYKENAMKALNKALALKSLGFADNAIQAYKNSAEKYTRLFSEAAEYYKMKDYADDDFKKGDQMHAPIIKSYQDFLKADQGIRNIIEKIADEQALKRIEAFKSKDPMLFYYVEKAQYLAKKFYSYANHKEDFMTLDANEIQKKQGLMRAHYKEFKEYKQKNENIFKDNSQYTGYLEKFSDYLSVGKDFYLRVKSKKFYDDGEEDFFKNLPPQALEAILSNKKGSVSQLLKSYNGLVRTYNGLNM